MDLDGAFKSTCKVLFKQELGKLSDFHDYLSEMVMPFQVRKSSISGKDVMLSVPYYTKDARFISHEEMPLLKPPEFRPDDIKDFDSLAEVAKETAFYCGNKILGKCSEVHNVDNCVDCAFVSNSHNVWQDRFCAYASYVRESEFLFGVNAVAICAYSMRSQEGVEYTRCFETHYSSKMSDSYYAFNCIGCREIIFGFNLRSKKYAIGNLELPKDKYQELKIKLIGEMTEKLKKNKKIFSISDAVNRGVSNKDKRKPVLSPYYPVPQKVEGGFNQTTKIVLGKERFGANSFSKWLLSRSLVLQKIIGAHGQPTYKIERLPVVRDVHHSRITDNDNALRSASNAVKGEITLNSLLDFSGKSYVTFEFIDGTNEGNVDVTSVFHANYCCRCWDATNSKYCGFTTAVVRSDYVFGGDFRLALSHFILDCQDSIGLSVCLNVDSSNNCRNAYFCHNCENLDHAIFCFNVKSLRYAVCNVEVGREQFMRIRKILLDYVNKQLDEKKDLDFGVFSIK